MIKGRKNLWYKERKAAWQSGTFFRLLLFPFPKGTSNCFLTRLSLFDGNPLRVQADAAPCACDIYLFAQHVTVYPENGSCMSSPAPGSWWNPLNALVKHGITAENGKAFSYPALNLLRVLARPYRVRLV